MLIVDDNVDGAESLALMLRLSGHDVRTAHSGLAALETARQFRPGVVFLDIGMPGMNGYEVAERLRRERGLGGVILVAVTGWGTEEDRQKALAAGFSHHLTKPAEGAQVAALLAGIESAP